MTPIQVYFTDSEAAAVKAWARARRTTTSEVIRQAARAVVHSDEEDPLFAIMGMFSWGGTKSINSELAEAIGAAKSKSAAAKPVRGRGRMARRTRST